MTYSAKEREAIIAHVLAEAATGRPVSRTLAEDEGMPDRVTFWRWHADDEALRNNLARARMNGSDALLDQAVAIADEPVEDQVGVADKRVRIDTRIRAAQMLAPRKYGPKMDLTTGGEKLPGAINVTGLSTEALRELAAAADAPDNG